VQLAEAHASESIAASKSRYPLLSKLGSASAWVDLGAFPFAIVFSQTCKPCKAAGGVDRQLVSFPVIRARIAGSLTGGCAQRGCK
jgi:hypothetical protein